MEKQKTNEKMEKTEGKQLTSEEVKYILVLIAGAILCSLLAFLIVLKL